jgi:nitroreductase
MTHPSRLEAIPTAHPERTVDRMRRASIFTGLASVAAMSAPTGYAADPALGELRPLIETAGLAPSSHNTQPWIFTIREQRIHLLADRTRALPVNDPMDRELTISCGCALFNLRVAAAAAGLRARVEVLPSAIDADLLATVELERAGQTLADAGLLDAVKQRRTYRERFADRAVTSEQQQALMKAALAEGAELHVLGTESQRQAAAKLVAKGDEIQWSNPSWRRELAAWMHPRRQGDGLPMPAAAAPVAQFAVRSFDMGSGVAAKDRELADESPLLAVLSTSGDQPRDWMATGQALQRLLLVGVQLGLQASYLNQPAQVAALRPDLQGIVGRPGYAQLLLRMGVPRKTLQATPRRPVDALVLAAT